MRQVRIAQVVGQQLSELTVWERENETQARQASPHLTHSVAPSSHSFISAAPGRYDEHHWSGDQPIPAVIWYDNEQRKRRSWKRKECISSGGVGSVGVALTAGWMAAAVNSPYSTTTTAINFATGLASYDYYYYYSTLIDCHCCCSYNPFMREPIVAILENKLKVKRIG